VANAFYNPFQQGELTIPEDLRESVNRYSRRFNASNDKADPESDPFARYVDVWMMAVCLGALRALESNRIPDPPRSAHRFIWGNILDPMRIELLEIVAISIAQDPFVIQQPKRVLEIANRLAADGLPRVLEMMEDGHGKPLWNITHHLLELLDSRSGSAFQDRANI
jgi:hypothetical protein